MRGNYLRKRKKTYGIYGMGSIRFAIALANYYSSFLKKRVAIGEVGDGNLYDVSEDNSIRNNLNLIDDNLIGFTRMKVDYYPYFDTESIMKLSSEEYDVIIWIFQQISHDYMNFYRMCDTRIFLCNIASYNRRLFCKTKNLLENGMVDVDIYCYLLSKQDRRWYEKVVGNSRFFSKPKEVPFIKNPDKLSREEITFLEKTAAG